MKSTKFLTFALTLILSLTFLASCNDDDDTVALRFSTDKAALVVDDSLHITITGGTEPYTVALSDKSIASASVAKNVITFKGLKTGKVTVVVTDKDQHSGSFWMDVRKLATDKGPVYVLAGKEEKVNILGGTAPYTVKVKDEAVATATLAESVVTVKGIKIGSTTMTITDKAGETTTVYIAVR